MQSQSEQSDDLFKVIPGYREAVQKEDAERERVFGAVPESICGLCVRPFTFPHLLSLRAIGSPFIVGAVPSKQDVALFLWRVSFEYDPAIKIRDHLGTVFPKLASKLFDACRKRFSKSLPAKPIEAWIDGIQNYILDAFQDGPRSNGEVKFRPSFYSGPVSLVMAICPVINCSPGELLAMPVKQIFQYQRAIKLQNNPNAILWNPSDELRGKYLDSLNNGRGN